MSEEDQKKDVSPELLASLEHAAGKSLEELREAQSMAEHLRLLIEEAYKRYDRAEHDGLLSDECHNDFDALISSLKAEEQRAKEAEPFSREAREDARTQLGIRRRQLA